jgi:hypothetical protein
MKRTQWKKNKIVYAVIGKKLQSCLKELKDLLKNIWEVKKVEKLKVDHSWSEWAHNFKQTELTTQPIHLLDCLLFYIQIWEVFQHVYKRWVSSTFYLGLYIVRLLTITFFIWLSSFFIVRLFWLTTFFILAANFLVDC